MPTLLHESGFWLRIASLFLARSGRSTTALSLMVVSAVAMLIFLSALAVGVNDAMVRNSVSLFSGHITGFDLPQSVGPDRLAAEGVAGVVKRVPVPGIIAGAEHFETVVMLGIDPAAERRHTAFWKKTVEGAFPAGGGKEVFISQPLAELLHVKPGEVVRFSPGDLEHFSPLTVAGIYKTEIEQLDRGIAFCPLDALLQAQRPWTAAVFLKDGADPDRVLAAYRQVVPEAQEFKSWSDLMPDLRQLIDLNYISMSIVTVLVFGVVSLGIACAFVIFIMRSLREYGIMRAMGVTSREMMCLITMEVLLMNLAASAAGILVGAAAVLLVGRTGIDLTAFTSHNRYFAVSGLIFPRLTVFSLWSPPALALLFSLFASLWPAVLVTRKKTVDILRSV